MYRSMAAGSTCEQESSRAVQELAGQLRLQAEAVESVRERLRGAESISWESPAGRNFRTYLAERGLTVAATAAYLREVTLSLDAYGAELANARGDGVLG